MKAFRLLPFLWLAAAYAVAQAIPARYVIRDLGPYPLSEIGPGIAPAEINEAGHIAGWFYAPPTASRHAFRLREGILEDLGVYPGAPEFFQSFGRGINNHDQIVGEAQSTTDLVLHPVLFDGNQVIDLRPGTLPGAASAEAINDSGQITGMTHFTEHAPPHAFLYSQGSLTDLGTLPGGLGSYGKGINSHGHVVGGSSFMTPDQNGTHAFLYKDGTMIDLGALPLGSHSSAAEAINDSGQIVGVSASASPARAFLYSNGKMTDLGTLGGAQSAARAINEHGVIVGGADVVPEDSHGFVWAGGLMRDLNDLVPAVAGRRIVEALDINNRGQILATGYVDGVFHSFFLSPVGPGDFYTLTPCRILDTRDPDGPYGGPALDTNSERVFFVGGRCGIPPTARAISMNMTVVAPTGPGSISLSPAGEPHTIVSTMSWRSGQTRANNAIVPPAATGDIRVRLNQVGGSAHLVVDVTGYFY